MEDGPTRTHTRCTRLAREPTRGTAPVSESASVTHVLATDDGAHALAEHTHGGIAHEAVCAS